LILALETSLPRAFDTPPEPRKTPRQGRAIATCAAIIEAAARILEDEGPAALNTNRIAERAGVSIGTLYQYYPDKETILVALIRRERRLLLDQLCAIPDTGTQPLAALISAAIAHQFARPTLALALERIETTLALDTEAKSLAQATARRSADLLAKLFVHCDESDFLTAVLITRALINAAAEGALPQQGLAERVQLAVVGYLEKGR
jgi:AcrR family transcriptional regulator